MKEDLEHFFSSLDQPEPPQELRDAIRREIARRERRAIVLKLAGMAAVLCASVAFAAEGSLRLVAELSRSGFFDIVSLGFSDLSVAAADLPDTLLSLIESFPMFSAALVLAGIAATIWSFAAFFDEMASWRPRGLSLIK